MSFHSRITDLEWSPTDSHTIATTCDKGEVRVFDIRTTTTPLLNLQMGGAGSSVSWCPSNSNLIAACNREGFNVWDTRMLVTSHSHQTDTLWSDRSIHHSGPSNIVNQATWAHSEHPCLITASSSSHLTWWDGLTGERFGEGGEKLDHQHNTSTPPSTPFPISCTLLSMPTGRGILTANRVAAEQNREAPDGPSTIPRSLSAESLPSHIIPEKLELQDDVSPMIQTLVDVMDEIDNPGLLSTPIWINSFPRLYVYLINLTLSRKEYSLTTLFEPPTGDRQSDQLVSSREQVHFV